jgi:carbamoyl-phosphate synthase large subunit
VGATVLVSDPATIAIAMDKRKTHAFFLGNGFDTPVLYEWGGDSVADRMKYPLVIKPAVGSAAIGFTLIADPDSFAFYKDHVQDPLVQEYVEGDEFTLDILVDFEGRVRCVVPRKRLEVRAGEVSKAVTVRNPFIIETGRRVAEALPGAFGPITVQGFLTPDGKFKLIEINPRFGGGHPLAIQAGANFPRWIIEMMIGSADATDYTGWADGLVMLRYDTAVFVEETAIL